MNIVYQCSICKEVYHDKDLALDCEDEHFEQDVRKCIENQTLYLWMQERKVCDFDLDYRDPNSVDIVKWSTREAFEVFTKWYKRVSCDTSDLNRFISDKGVIIYSNEINEWINFTALLKNIDKIKHLIIE